MLKNMKVGIRLGLGFFLVLAIMIGIIIVSLNAMASSAKDLNEIVMKINVRAEMANEMSNKIRDVSLAINDEFLGNDDEKKQQIVAHIAELRESYDKAFSKFEELTPNDLPEIWEKITQIKAIQKLSRKLDNEVLNLAAAGKTNEAADLLHKEASPKIKQWISLIEDILASTKKRAIFRYDEIKATQNDAYKTILMLGITAFIFTLITAIVLTLGITGPLEQCIQAAKRIYNKDLTGDLSESVERRDELGVMARAFNGMAIALREQIAEIADGVNILASSSSQIMVSTSQLASGAVESSAATSETMTTVEEVRQAARLSSEKAKNVADNSQQIVQISQAGKDSVEQTNLTMLNIREQMDAIAKNILRLSEQSQAIGGIIASVTDLADQSNLLAVNAGIEAARAGDQGKGFSVVAQEIKSLAEQSKQATTQIRAILTDVQKTTNVAVMAAEQGTKAVEAGVKQSIQAGDAINSLSECIFDAAKMSVQIVASSQQQVVGMDQIGVAMNSMNQASAQNATALTQTKTAAQNLNELGQKLKNLVIQFKVKES